MKVCLFKDIVLTDGYNRSLVIDLTRGLHFLIPRLWSKILSRLNEKISSRNIRQYLENPDKKVLSDLYDFLIRNELFFEVDEQLISCFPSMQTTYETPAAFDRISICLSDKNSKEVVECFDHEIIKNIRVVELYLEDGLFNRNFSHLNDLIDKSNASTLFSLRVNQKFKKPVQELVKRYPPKIASVLYASSSIDKSRIGIGFIKNKFPIFNIGRHCVFESRTKNPFFHKTLFIDTEGNFIDPGNAEKESKLNMVRLLRENPELLDSMCHYEIADIPLSRVEICKECEFNRICIDYRAPYKNGNCYNKEDCSYNPYISKWENQSGYIPSSRCGEYSEKGEFLKNSELIRSLNKKLWV